MALSEEDRATLSAYLDGELDEAASQKVEARLNVDPEARAAFETLRDMWSLLDFLPRATPHVDFTNRTLERLALDKEGARAPRVRRRLPAPLLWGAGILIAACLGFWVGGLLPTVVPVPATDPPEVLAEIDDALVRRLRVIEQWPLYREAEDVDFIRDLEKSDLFPEDAGTDGGRP